MKHSKSQTDPYSPWGSTCRFNERNRASPQDSPELNCKTTGFSKTLQASPSPSRASVPFSQLRAGNNDRIFSAACLTSSSGKEPKHDPGMEPELALQRRIQLQGLQGIKQTLQDI